MIPDLETEARLANKVLWAARISLGLLYITLPIVPVFFTEQLTHPLFFSTYILLALLLAYFSKKIALGSELRELQPLDVTCRSKPSSSNLRRSTA